MYFSFSGSGKNPRLWQTLLLKERLMYAYNVHFFTKILGKGIK
ncbi:hypothetical protein B4099_3426 [Heyndrickxia coagulans]|uniref:Uncharacterized protein n=1 Tax=Heyndrickxia coagulans TaxID=1398 RepID=A0A150K8S3_HEYCO|nr:hypothetical protein B4099_3426 [Heyndrickxia coagulans]